MRDRAGDDFEVWRGAANEAPQTHDGVEAAGLGSMARRRRDLERAGHTQHHDILDARTPAACERSEGAGLQLVGHEVVDSGRRQARTGSRLAEIRPCNARTVTVSASLESRLALLEKRAGALAHVVGRRR